MKDERLLTDPDFILAPKFENSLVKMLDRYPTGVSDAVAAKALGISEQELSAIRQTALSKLREKI